MKAAYELISKIYDLIDVIYFREKGNNPRKAVLNLIPDEDITVLDLCCGTMGNGIDIAKQRKKVKLTGADLSKDMLAAARAKLSRQNIDNVTLMCADASRTGLKSGSCDFIILSLVLHEMEESVARNILKEVFRLLKQDGKLIVLEWENSIVITAVYMNYQKIRHENSIRSGIQPCDHHFPVYFADNDRRTFP